MKTKHFYCFRHGETDWNQAGRFQGTEDIPLNAEGRRQATDLIPFIQQKRIQIIYSSPLQRALETATIVAASLAGIPIVQEPDLTEVNFGAATGLLMSEVIQQFGEQALARWRSSNLQDDFFGFPRGETKEGVRKRAMGALQRILLQTDPYEVIGISTHGFWLKQVMIGLSAENPHGLKNGEIVYLKYDIPGAAWYFVERLSMGITTITLS